MGADGYQSFVLGFCVEIFELVGRVWHVFVGREDFDEPFEDFRASLGGAIFAEGRLVHDTDRRKARENIRNLCKRVVSHVVIFLYKFGDKLGPEIGLWCFNNRLENVLEHPRGPDRVIRTGDMCHPFFDQAHAQRQSSNLEISSEPEKKIRQSIHPPEM